MLSETFETNKSPSKKIKSPSKASTAPILIDTNIRTERVIYDFFCDYLFRKSNLK
jgi:hypothetical protein